MGYWRLRVQRPHDVEEAFDLRVHRSLSLGDDSQSDICLESTDVPSHFVFLRRGFKAPKLRLTNEIANTLKGKFHKKKAWSGPLYKGFEYEILGTCEFSVAGIRFQIEAAEAVGLGALAPEVNKLERKHKAHAYGMSLAGHAAVALAMTVWSLLPFNRSSDFSMESAQRITVAKVEELFPKVKSQLLEPRLEEEILEVEAEEVAAAPRIEEPRAAKLSPTKRVSKQTGLQAKNKSKMKVARGGNTVQVGKAKDINRLGILAVQASAGASTQSVSLASSAAVVQAPRVSSVHASLGIGQGGFGIGSGSNVAPVAKLTEISGRAYDGEIRSQVTGRGISNVKLARKEIEIRGGLDAAVIRQIIEERLSEVRYCYENALLSDSSLSGKVSTSWTIQADGSVSTLRSSSDEIKESSLHNCLQERIKGWKFPQPKGGGVVHVKYPFIFNKVDS